MATTAYGITNYSSALRQVIQPYIQNNVPKQIKLMQTLKTNDNVQIFNNNFYVAMRSNRHGGVANIANDKSKLNTGSSPIVQGTVTPRYLTATFDISDVLMKASANDKLAVENAMTFQMNALVDDFSKSANRQWFSDGAGVIAMTSETGGSVGASTAQIQYPNADMTTEGRAVAYYGTSAGGINGDLRPQKYFTDGQIVGIGSAGTAVGTIATSGVSGVGGGITGTAQLGTLVFTGSTPIPASAPIYILDGDADAAGTTEVQGMRLALSEGTSNYIGLARTLDIMNPQVLGTAQNQALTINNMESIYLAAYEYAKDGDRYAWFGNRTVVQKFGDQLTAMRRTVNRVELVSGWGGLDFQIGDKPVPVVMDYDAPDGELFLINLDTWTVCEIAPMSFVQDDLLRRVDYITFQKVFTWYSNLICRAPAANGRMVRQTK